MVQLRAGKEEDINAIARILVTTWRECYKDFLPCDFLNKLSEEHQARRHLKAMDLGTRYLVAENAQGQILGFTSFGNSRRDYIKSEKEIYTIYVDPKEQGARVGYQLLFFAIEHFGEEVLTLGVEVMADNPYKSFYEKYGFSKVSEGLLDLGDFEVKTYIYNKNLNDV